MLPPKDRYAPLKVMACRSTVKVWPLIANLTAWQVWVHGNLAQLSTIIVSSGEGKTCNWRNWDIFSWIKYGVLPLSIKTAKLWPLIWTMTRIFYGVVWLEMARRLHYIGGGSGSWSNSEEWPNESSDEGFSSVKGGLMSSLEIIKKYNDL